MYGLIQKLLLTNPEYGNEMIFDKPLMLNYFSATNQTELLTEFQNFLDLRSKVYQAHQSYAGAADRISVDNSIPNSYYFYYKLSDEDWNYITGLSEWAIFVEARDTLFPKLGWVNLGYRRILNPIPAHQLEERGLLAHTYFRDIWDTAIPV